MFTNNDQDYILLMTHEQNESRLILIRVLKKL